MNKHLDEALAKITALPDEQQEEVAEMLLDYVEANETGVWLTKTQIAEVERRLATDEPYADETAVRVVFDRLTT